MGTLCEDLHTYITVTCLFLLRMRNVSNKILAKIETYIVCSMTFSDN